MNVDRDVLLVQPRELECRGHEVLLFVLVDIDPSLSCQYAEIGRKYQGMWDLPWAENA